MNYCSNCGNELSNDNFFCDECGKQTKRERNEKRILNGKSDTKVWVSGLVIILFIGFIHLAVSKNPLVGDWRAKDEGIEFEVDRFGNFQISMSEQENAEFILKGQLEKDQRLFFANINTVHLEVNLKNLNRNFPLNKGVSQLYNEFQMELEQTNLSLKDVRLIKDSFVLSEESFSLNIEKDKLFLLNSTSFRTNIGKILNECSAVVQEFNYSSWELLGKHQVYWFTAASDNGKILFTRE